MTNWESGEKEASSGSCLELRCPVKDCRVEPLYESISLMTDPLVEMRMDLPSGANFNPVHSISLLSAEIIKIMKNQL